MAVYVAANIAVVVIVIGLIYASRGRVARHPESWGGALRRHDDPRDDTPERRLERHNLPEPTRTKTPNENAVDLLGSANVMMPKHRRPRRSRRVAS
jgi:hypothetical protein